MRSVSLLFFIPLFWLFAGCSHPVPTVRHTLPAACTVYDMKQAACIDETALVRRLAPYRVLFAGDHHASAEMHASFARLLAALGRSGRRVMLANEWFTPGDDDLLSRYAAGRFDGNFTEAVGWEKKAGYPFASYAPIYRSVRETGGGLYGINMDDGLRKALSDNNLSALSQTQRRFFDGLDMNLTAHRSMLAPFFAHCHARRGDESDRSCTERMYRVQVGWDTYMAEQSARLAQERLRSPADLLVVFAGATHLAYGVGINARFARRTAEPFVTLLPVPEGTAEADVGEADYLLFYPEAEAKEGK